MDIRLNGNVIYKERLFTTQVMNDYMQAIGTQLDTYRIEEDEVVAIALERTPVLIATLFVLLEKYIPFMLIDVSQPEERVRYMLSNANIKKVIVNEGVKYDFGDLLKIQIDGSKCDHGSQDKREIRKNTSDIAYLMYTSGSTGKPKGVEVLRRGFENFIEAIPCQIDFKATYKIACLTKVTFDIFLLESVLALYKGLTVVLATEEERTNPRKVNDLIEKGNIDIIQMTPSALQLLNSVDKTFSCLAKVKIIMVGGESLPEVLLKQLQQYTHAKIYNMYGPTETTIWSTISDLTTKQEVNIGYPILNTQIYLLNEQMEQVKEGEVGEICIAGEGVARGYCNNSEATSAQFSRLPLETDTLVYKTGDLGRYNIDGSLSYIGRKDNQVKVRGHRIELEEIDNVLLEMGEINIAMTCYNPTAQGGELITFVVGNELILQKEIIAQLEIKLPAFMIPKKIIQVEQIKYTDNGKKDRAAMLRAYITHLEEEIVVPNNTLVEEESVLGQVQSIFAKMLNLSKEDLKREVLLTDLGIDSFTYIEILVKCEELYDIQFGEEALTYNAFENIGEIEEAILQRIR